MHAELKTRLNKIITQHFEKPKNQENASIDRRVAENAQLRKFIDIREFLMRPKFLELVDYLNERLVYSRVSTDEPVRDAGGRKVRSSNITLWLYSGANVSDDISVVPHFVIRWDEVNSVVKFDRSNITKYYHGTAEMESTALLHELTYDLIEERLFDFVKWVLR